MRIVKKIVVTGVVACLFIFKPSVIGQAAVYEYDNLNRVIKATYDDGSYEIFSYDKNGNIIMSKSYPAITKKPTPTFIPNKSESPSLGNGSGKSDGGERGQGGSGNESVPTVMPTKKPTPKPTTKPTPKPTGVTGNKATVPVKLKAPVITSLKVSDKGIVVKWKSVKETKSYQVYRSTKKNGTYKLIKTTSKTSFKDKKVKSGTYYYYKIRCVAKVKKYNSNYSKPRGVYYLCEDSKEKRRKKRT